MPNLLRVTPLAASARIDALMVRCEGAYADNTLHGYASDLRLFETWCASHGQAWLPADPTTVAAFIDGAVETLSTSSLLHRGGV